MTKNPFLLALLAFPVAMLTIAPRAFAQANPNPPDRLAYQGYLVDANGNALGTNAPKNYDVVFRIWNDPTATAPASRLWTEQQTVTVDKGYFSVVLGEGSGIGEPRPALSTVFAGSTASDRWIALTVKGIGAAGADANILPRLRLITSPYAFLASRATTVDGAALTSGTVPDTRLSGNVALLNRSPQNFSGTNTFAGRVGIGTTAPTRPLTVNGTGDNGISLVNNTPATGTPFAITTLDAGQLLIKDDVTGSLQFWMDKANSSFALNGGNVGIGTTTPVAKLHVAGGNLRLDSGFQITFADNGQIRSSDDNHRILFRRSENKLELREFGDIVLSPGAVGGVETAKAVILASGNMGVGTNNPQTRLHVVGATRVDGAATVSGAATLSGGATVTGGMSVSGTMSMAGAGNFLGSTPYVKFSDQKPKGTGGGTSVQGGINVRTFNTEYDPQSIASFNNSTNLVLPAGTYQCHISAPAFRVAQHQARLRIAGSTSLFLYGTSAFCDNGDGGDMTNSEIIGQFTLTGSSSLVIEHYTADDTANGLGLPVSASWTDGSPVEVYTVAEFWKLQ